MLYQDFFKRSLIKIRKLQIYKLSVNKGTENDRGMDGRMEKIETDACPDNKWCEYGVKDVCSCRGQVKHDGHG